MEGEWDFPLQSPRVTKIKIKTKKNIFMLEGKGWGGVLESWFREGEMGGKRGGGGGGGWWFVDNSGDRLLLLCKPHPSS